MAPATAHPTRFLAPEKVSLALARAIGVGDLDAAASCFARDACLITPDATAIRGREEIRPILAQLIGAGAQIEIEARSVLLGGEVALGSEHWRVHSRGINGAPFRQTSLANMVLRRLEGSWRLAIAAPWGWRA